MKFLIAGLLFATTAFANPFDAFVGDYAPTGAPKIHAEGSVKEKDCDRFFFRHLVGFSITADTHGYEQSHLLRFYNSGPQGHGWFGHPVMEYKYTNDFGSGGSYAKTTGEEAHAQNELGEWDRTRTHSLVVSLRKTDRGVLLEMADRYFEGKRGTGGCVYEVGLARK